MSNEIVNNNQNIEREDRCKAWQAFGKFQAKHIKVEKKAAVTDRSGKVSYKYADLEDLIDAIRPAMTECELAYTQGPGGEDKCGLHTRIVHFVSGYVITESIAYDTVQIAIGANGNRLQNQGQAYGSLCTYFKKYQLASLLGIATTDDKLLDADVFGAENGYTPEMLQLKDKIMQHVIDQKYSTAQLEKAFKYFKVKGLEYMSKMQLQQLLARIIEVANKPKIIHPLQDAIEHVEETND